MKLFIVRHGETKENVDGILMGHNHGVLTEKGKIQAQEIAEVLKDYKFDHIYTSDLNRCVDTAEIIKQFHSETPITLAEDLRELNMGTLQGMSKNLVNWNDMFKDRVNGRIGGGESLNELKTRGLNFVKKLYSKHAGKNILLVTHNGWMAQVMAYFKGVDSREIFDKIGNAQVFEIDVGAHKDLLKSKPIVSIIMPTYNRAYIIKKAINSVLDQSNSNWELIVVDDGSTDNTKDVVTSYADDRIRYVYQNNGRPAAARNHGVSISSAKWIAYLDSDNELLPNYIDVTLKQIANKPQTVFAFPRAHRTLELYEDGKLVKAIDDSSDTPLGVTLKDVFNYKLHVDTNGLMHLRSIFTEGIIWDSNLKAMEDWDFVMSMGEKYPDGFLYVEEVLYNYHQRYGGDGLVSSHQYKDWADIFESIYQKHKNDKMLEGQTWYPSKVEKWNRLQKEFDEGKLPPYHLYYFQK